MPGGTDFWMCQKRQEQREGNLSAEQGPPLIVSLNSVT